MQDIERLIKLENNYEAKLGQKQGELEDSIAKELEKAKSAVEATKSAAEGEEKKAAERGVAEGKKAAKDVSVEYRKKLLSLKKAYEKNGKPAVKDALSAVLG